jgi:prepilin-type N-terminal cleavage/methylation domain-containing protein
LNPALPAWLSKSKKKMRLWCNEHGQSSAHLKANSNVGPRTFGRLKGVSVKQSELKSQLKMSCAKDHRGFSMIEVCVVISLILIISAMAIMALQPGLQDARFDTAMRQVMDQLRQAREYSIANRRYVQVTFPTVVIAGTTQYQVVMTERNAPPYGPAGAGADVILSTTPIEAPAQFYKDPATTDTPDVFGNTSAIEFEAQSPGPIGGMLFQSDGELVDGVTFQPINGTVSLGFPGLKTASRAITVLGSTGRVHGWKWNGTAWFQL